jgi:molybdopterin synthase sulfur carrier subunit
MPEITVTVLYFAAASTATGCTEEQVSLPIDSTLGRFPLASLASVLVARHPRTSLDKILETSAWSVDVEMVEDPGTVMLKGGEEIAIICPVSGG